MPATAIPTMKVSAPAISQNCEPLITLPGRTPLPCSNHTNPKRAINTPTVTRTRRTILQFTPQLLRDFPRISPRTNANRRASECIRIYADRDPVSGPSKSGMVCVFCCRTGIRRSQRREGEEKKRKRRKYRSYGQTPNTSLRESRPVLAIFSGSSSQYEGRSSSRLR
jgi:hypothetical protein